MGWSIRRRLKATPGKILNLKAVVAPNEAAAAQYYPAIYWYSMMKIPDASEFGGKGEIPANANPEPMAELDEERTAALTVIRWASAPRARSRERCRTHWASSPLPRKRGFAASSPGQGGRNNVRPRSSKNSAPPPSRYFADWTDRIAKGELAPCEAAAAARRRAQHRRHHLGLAQRQALPSRPDRLGSALPDGQCLWSGVRVHRAQRRHHSDTRSENTHRHELDRLPVRDAEYASGARAGLSGKRQTHAAVALLGRRKDLDEQGQQPQRHV